MPKPKPKRNNRRKKQRQAVVLEITQKLRDDLDELVKDCTSRIEIRDAHVKYFLSCNAVQREMLEKIFKEDEDLYIG